MGTDCAVEFARTATVTEAPPAVERHVRTRVLDTLAATTAGYRTPGIGVTRGYALDRLDGDEATIIDGTGRRLAVAGAALANGTAANTLDVDDGHRDVKGHPAAVVVPPALGAAEAVDATVADLLDAVFVGYELAVRAGLAIHATDGVYTGTGSWGAVGAAAAVSRLRELSDDAFAHALSTAEYHAPRVPIMRGVEQPGMTKDGIGWGGYVGTVAADLAARGFTGSGTVFDGTNGTVTETLGDTYYVTEGYLKPYPCCRWAHPGVDAVLALREQYEIDLDEVEEIRVHTFEEATHLGTRHPATVEEAEYSYPYPVAVALARGEFTPQALTESTRTDPNVQRLADTVTLHVDDPIDDRFPEVCLARVEIVTASRTLTSDTTHPRGSQDRPLSREDQKAKVERLCRPTLDVATVERVADVLSRREAPVQSLVALWS